MRFLATVLVALSCGLPRAVGDDFKHIVIGSWNIEFLGTRNPAQKPKPLAEHIRMSGVDLLALQEIGDTDSGPNRRNSVLDEAFALLNASDGSQWEYLLFENKIANDRSQLCGVAWNKSKIERMGDPLKISVHDDPNDPFNSWDRHPHAMKFRIVGDNAGDLVVISVHMKSNTDGQSFGKQQREFEAGVLAGKISEVKAHFHDRDVIILGDFNTVNADEPCLEKFAQQGFRDLNVGDGGTFITGAPFDRILVPETGEMTEDSRPGVEQEFVFTRQYILTATDKSAHDKWLSDHQMILAAVRSLPDDDANE